MKSLLIVTASDVEKIIAEASPAELADEMGRVFARLSNANSDIALPERKSVQTSAHTVLFMPARIAPSTAIKIVSVPSSDSDKRGLPATTLVLDEDTGAVRAVINASSLTAIRTAAGASPFTCVLMRTTPISSS
jgi:ornithine cyclodeaminase/alanine dehydrogenase-like protein (mu-crystallin family)